MQWVRCWLCGRTTKEWDLVNIGGKPRPVCKKDKGGCENNADAHSR